MPYARVDALGKTILYLLGMLAAVALGIVIGTIIADILLPHSSVIL